MNIPLPRFQGNAIKKDNGWSWEIHVSMLGDNDGGETYITDLIFETKELAIESIKLTISDMINTISDKFPEMGINPGEYVDMKTNSTRRWDKKDEQ